jgi:YgiT-type zinc finger domain-containing protein
MSAVRRRNEIRKTAASFFIDEKIIINDVPAEVCADCGEAFTKSSVAGRIEDILDKAEILHTEMSVLHFKAA